MLNTYIYFLIEALIKFYLEFASKRYQAADNIVI